MYLLYIMNGYKQELDSASGPVGPVLTGPVFTVFNWNSARASQQIIITMPCKTLGGNAFPYATLCTHTHVTINTALVQPD